MRVRRLTLSAALVATSVLLLSVVPGAESSGAARTSTPAVAAAPTVTETLAAAHQKSLLNTSLAVARVNATLNRTPRFEYAKSKTVSLTDQRAKKVVAAALSRVSTGQYVWGASGGNSFDCSGLMMYAYRQIGISLPHSSSAQSRLGKAVSIKNLKPGDLLFFYSPCTTSACTSATASSCTPATPATTSRSTPSAGTATSPRPAASSAPERSRTPPLPPDHVAN